MMHKQLLTITIISLFTLVFAGCSTEKETAPPPSKKKTKTVQAQRKTTPLPKKETPPVNVPKKELKTLRINYLLTNLNSYAARIKSEPTSLRREEAFNVVTKKASEMLNDAMLEAVVTISDVKILKPGYAKVTIKDLQAPSLTSAKHLKVRLTGTIDLPISKKEALAIRPGQKLYIRSIAEYHANNVRPPRKADQYAFAYIFYNAIPSRHAVLMLQLQQYKIR